MLRAWASVVVVFELWNTGSVVVAQWAQHVGAVVVAPGLWNTGSVVVAPGLWNMGSVVVVRRLSWSMESSWTGDLTCVPCLGRQILLHCTTRAVPRDGC